MKPGLVPWMLLAAFLMTHTACDKPKEPLPKKPIETKAPEASPAPKAPDPTPKAPRVAPDAPASSEIPDLPPDFRADKPKPDVEGGQPTSAEARTLALGDWTLTHALSEGKATHATTKETVSLWKANPRNCAGYKFEGRLASVVGTLVTFELRESGKCDPAASGNAFYTVDLSKKGPQKTTLLTEHFEEARIKAALDKHPWLANARSRAGLFKCIYKESDLTRDHFALHGLKEGKAVVRIGVGHGCDAQLGLFTQLDIELTPSPDLKKAMEAAQSRKTLGQHLHSVMQ